MHTDFDKYLYLVGKRPGKVDCNEECAKLERNRRVALALQIENPDMSAKLVGPKYSEFLKELAKIQKLRSTEPNLYTQLCHPSTSTMSVRSMPDMQ